MIQLPYQEFITLLSKITRIKTNELRNKYHYCNIGLKEANAKLICKYLQLTKEQHLIGIVL